MGPKPERQYVFRECRICKRSFELLESSNQSRLIFICQSCEGHIFTVFGITKQRENIEND